MCPNSNRFNGYTFSHEGYFEGGNSKEIHSSDTVKDCAAGCRSSDSLCVAFQFRDAGNRCWHYSNTGTGIGSLSGNVAYVKCIGNQNII